MQENIAKCVTVMKSRNVHEKGWRREVGDVKSLASMLQRGEVMNMNIVYYVGDLSAIFQILRSDDKKKRERDNYEDEHRPAKRMTFVTSN